MPVMAEQPEEQRVPAYVALVRIGAVVGMSVAAAFGIFLLVGGWWVQGAIGLLIALPFFAVMRLVERTAESP
jgi:type IV secretory pathway VirB3-like protein